MNSASRKCQMRKIKCQFALTKRQEGREGRRGKQLEMRQNTFSKCKRRNVASLRRCVVVAIKCLASSLPTPAPSGVEVSGSSSGSNSVAATNNAQIWRNATQRIESIGDSFQFAVFRFIYHLSLEIEIAFLSGFFLRLLLLLPLPSRLLLLLCFCNCSVSLCSAFCCCLSLFLCLFAHSALLSLGPSPQVIIVNN